NGSTHNKGYGLLRRKLEPPRSRARMRAESEDRDRKDSQEQIPKHLNIPRPQGKSYTPTGRSRYVPSVLVSPSHTQTQTRKHSQEQTPDHQHLRRPPGKSNPNPNPNPHPYDLIYPSE